MNLSDDQKIPIAVGALQAVITAKPDLIEAHPAKLAERAVVIAVMVAELEKREL